jgi:hypothetical protein
MTFLLHLPIEARNMLDSPQLSHKTNEFLFQVVWECSCWAVLEVCNEEINNRTPKEEFAHCFGGVPKN